MEVWPATELLELQITEKEKILLKEDILEVAFVFSGMLIIPATIKRVNATAVIRLKRMRLSLNVFFIRFPLG